MSAPENPPAFPQNLEGGMSMRDWLAGQALAGLLANAPFTNDLGRKAGPGGIVSGTAAIAYAYADAMLSERKRAA